MSVEMNPLTLPPTPKQQDLLAIIHFPVFFMLFLMNLITFSQFYYRQMSSLPNMTSYLVYYWYWINQVQSPDKQVAEQGIGLIAIVGLVSYSITLALQSWRTIDLAPKRAAPIANKPCPQPIQQTVLWIRMVFNYQDQKSFFNNYSSHYHNWKPPSYQPGTMSCVYCLLRMAGFLQQQMRQ